MRTTECTTPALDSASPTIEPAQPTRRSRKAKHLFWVDEGLAAAQDGAPVRALCGRRLKPPASELAVLEREVPVMVVGDDELRVIVLHVTKDCGSCRRVHQAYLRRALARMRRARG